MKFYTSFFCLFVFVSAAQTLKDCKYRFDNYLNFKGSLNRFVKFENNAFYLLNKGEKEFAVYANELVLLADYFQNTTIEEQERLIRIKKTNKFTKKQIDSLVASFKRPAKRTYGTPNLPLKGYRIALDPGHFSTNLTDAEAEQKYLYFVADTINARFDTVKIFESALTFNTAHILKNMLEEKGAEVFITRSQSDFTSFNCTYQDWIKRYKQRTLDSLLHFKILPQEKYKKLLNATNHDLFWDFFRDYDLANRAAKINAYKPNATAIIHYNVDEKNAPWKQHTQKNFSMTFIGGAFTNDNMDKTENKINFLRLILSNQLNRSEYLSAKTVSNFGKLLQIPLAKATDADYLKNNCLVTKSAGVFCRNLVLCRKINSPLVYGESLYQDNEKESRLLMRSDMDIYGIKANDRLYKVALSYYQAMEVFLTK